MDWYRDSKACLNIAEQLIIEIENMTDETVKHKHLIPYMKVKIKNSLENCRSPLDYAAQYIFNEYCRSEYLAREQKKPANKQLLTPNIYYPIRKNATAFDLAINKHFFILKNKNPDVIKIFKNGQLFENSEKPFLYHLNTLTNENKHRNLSTHKRNTEALVSGSFNGITIKNSTFKNVDSAILINGHNINFVDPSPYDHFFDTQVEIEYLFKELDLSVVPTLKDIHHGVSLIIHQLQETIKKEER